MTGPAVELPEAVRRRVVDVAAERLGALPPEEVPASLRPFAKFAPGRRRQVVLPIAAALETDEAFREAVARGFRDNSPDLVAALEQGSAVPAADPVDVAAVAYLLRSPGWEERVARVTSDEAAARAASQEEVARQAVRQLDRDAEAETEALQARLGEAQAALTRALDDLERERRRAREAGERARAAERTATEQTELRARESQTAAAAEASLVTQVDGLRRRLTDAEASLEKVRRDTRDAREAADIRRWLLLDTLARGVAGLREELSPAPPTRRPADLVDGVVPPDTDGVGLAVDDPATVDALLALPNAHLVVDGYNVTKTGYPDLPLEDQRTRLVSGLAALAARTGAEVTCVFDGAAVQVRVPTAAAKRVRVRFSPAGQTADELIRRLVRAEPTGRPVTVCSADKEVVDGVRRFGARIVAPSALLTRLARA
jgi:predicted RNA-binding protein with PIN domain